MAKHRRGLYRPKFKDKHGKTQESLVYWCAYKHGYKIIRESTGYRTVAEAQIFLDQRRGVAANGGPIQPRADKVLMKELFQDKIDEYKMKDHDTLSKLERVVKKRLRPAFENRTAHTITESDLASYIVKMKTKEFRPGRKYKPNTIDGDLRLLKATFKLGIRRKKIQRMPDFEFLNQDIPRNGFFTDEQLELFCLNLPEDVAGPVRLAASTAWRTPSETLTREWRHVDLQGGFVWLDGNESKNEEPKRVAFTEELRTIFERQWEIHQELLKKGKMVRFVFHHAGDPLFHKMKRSREVKPSDYFRQSWKAACKETGLQRTPHDLCRTGIRILDDVVGRDVGKKISGRKTDCIYTRYNIVSEDRLRDAAAKLDARKKSRADAAALNHFKVTSK